MANPVAAPPILPPDADFGLVVDRPGPIRAADFEGWAQEPDNPVELVEGWVVPMSPGSFSTGELLVDLGIAWGPWVKERGWRIALDACHRLPVPANTVVFPDIAIHCVSTIEYLPGTHTVARVPELVVELLSEETAARDRFPNGAKFLAYQMAGVKEYYYAWPDGSEAAGFRLDGDRFVAIDPDADGFFASPLLEARLRLAPAALER